MREWASIAEFRRVRTRIQPYIRTTPMVPCEIPNVWLKLENLQRTHSFKVRGAFAAILDLVETNDKRTILAVSAGNHGQAIALAASTFGLKCVVVVPESAPAAKIEAIRKYGIELQVRGANYDEAEALTTEMAKDTSRYAFVSPYSDSRVVLGQGSLAFEIVEQLPQTGTILVSIGGGGLAAGVAAAAKQLNPKLRVIGIQAEVSAAIYESVRAGRMVTIPDRPSIADGIQGNIDLNTITFNVIQECLDDIVLVSEKAIHDSMHHLLFKEKLLTEGSAAATLAAVFERKIQVAHPVVALISGGNVDPKHFLV
jgi:threonine dehydratase